MGDVRLATWNLLHGRSLTTGEVDDDALQGAAKMLDADVVAIQEVDRDQRRSGHVAQTATVAHGLEAVWSTFVPTVWGEPGTNWEPVAPGDHDDGSSPAYGIGLVSRFPVRDVDVLRFAPAPLAMPLLVPGQGLVRVSDEPRAAVSALVEGPNGSFTAISTHLSFVPGFNVRQLRELVRWAQAKPAPRLLLGDLNLPGRLPRWASRWTQLASWATYPSWKPRVQFDHILADGMSNDSLGWAVDASASTRLPVSDHNALSVTLRRNHLGSVPG